MNKIKFLFLASTVAVAFAACKQAPKSDDAKTSEAQTVSETTGDVYKVDTAASKFTWLATKVSAYHSGNVKIKSGELRVADGQLVGGNFNLDMTTIKVTGPEGSNAEFNGKLQGHLTSPDFFDVQKYPDATFEITSVKPFSGAAKEDNDAHADLNEYKVTNPTHTVSGNLTIKGKTKNIEFPARIAVSGNDVTALAKFNVNRQDWGIAYPGKPDDLIRDEINFGISLKATK